LIVIGIGGLVTVFQHIVTIPSATKRLTEGLHTFVVTNNLMAEKMVADYIFARSIVERMTSVSDAKRNENHLRQNRNTRNG